MIGYGQNNYEKPENIHTCEYDSQTYEYSCKSCAKKDELYSQISDFGKDLWGFRPRFDWKLYRIESMQEYLKFILAHCLVCEEYKGCTCN